MPVCCRCNASGRCKKCLCVKGGKRCDGCLPSRHGRCCNSGGESDIVNSNSGAPVRVTSTPRLPSSHELPPLSSSPSSSTTSLSASSHTSFCYSCVCGRPDDSCMVQCHGPAKEHFHLSCAGLSPSFSGVNWCCLQCCIQLRHRTRVVKHIPKGARIQVATALSQLLESCTNQEDDSIVPWKKLLTFATSALALPPSSSPVQKCSLTSLIKQKVGMFLNDVEFPVLKSPEVGSQKSEGHKLKSCVEAKLSAGDVSGAVRILSSDAALSPFDSETLQALQEKHPPSPPDFLLPPPPSISPEPLQVSSEIIEKSIRSFKLGSSAGPDKLSPQHLKVLISRQVGEAGSRLLSALTAFANRLLSGNIPDQAHRVFFGANLIALRKPDGGVRPIAIGFTLRRMVAKAVSFLMFDSFGTALRSVQLGGCEVAVHKKISIV